MMHDEHNDQEIHDKEQVAVENNSVHDSYKEQYLRVSADFQNFKRRVERERARWIFDAQAVVLKPLLAIFADFDRAIAAVPANEEGTDKKEWLEGLELMQKNIAKTLNDLGVKEIDCSGQFNPEVHEALMHVDVPGKISGHIEQVFSKGYTFGEDVLIHAKVSVVK